jgi:hypothetical protein
MKKKRIFWSILSIVMVVMLSIGLSSCSKDDDEDGGSGGGNKAVVVDGKAYNMKYAWLEVGSGKYRRTIELRFSDTDLYDRDIRAQPQIRTQVVGIIINDYEYYDVQPGTYTAEVLFEDATGSYSYEMEGWKGIQSYTYAIGKDVQVIITKDGDNYAIAIPETLIHNYIANTGKDASIPFSFSYTGKIIQVESL